MAGLRDTEVIDLVAEAPDGTALLIIVKEGRWELKDDIPALQAKLNTYAQFALDGGLVGRYPHLDGRSVIIRLDSPTPPPDAVAEILTVAHAKLASYDISVTSAVSPQL